MIDFIIYTNTDGNYEIYDYTHNSPLTTETKIDIWTLDISSDNLSGIVQLDINDYIYNDRINNELYTITPTTLGVTSFEDGLYKFKMSINTTEVKTHYIILYNVINNRFKDILENYNYTFTISDVGYISYVDDSGDSNTEEIRVLSGLIDQLKNYKFQSYTATVLAEINDIIDKAERIASILEI